MKTSTSVYYQISTSQGLNLVEEFDNWKDVEDWEKENSDSHPDWRITSYSIKQIVVIGTWLK